jgi:hypothetical protein
MRMFPFYQGFAKAALAGFLLGGLAILALTSFFTAEAAAQSPSDKPLDEAGIKLAQEGHALLVKYCQQCHGDEYSYPGLDIRDRRSLVEVGEGEEKPFLIEGSSTESRIFERIIEGEMPPEGQPKPSEDEIELIRRWIDAGAVYPPSSRPKRNFVGEKTLLQLIADDLEKVEPDKRARTRYFSLAHLWNDRDLDDEYLSLVRAAVSKLINSLSSKSKVVPPQPIDDQQLVLRIDLADYGWTNRNHWQPMLFKYPYGLAVDSVAARKSSELTGCEIPYLRADWFVHYAARPPLYHQLFTFPDAVGIPEKLNVLEQRLAVDVFGNFQKGKLVRAAFTGEKSGVSDHNRMVERHDAQYGYYWPSYDSAGDSERQNFFLFPLGPVFNQDQKAAFIHDGGEMIFSTPNHLQGYMLSVGDGTRLDAGPQAIVKDPNRFSGSFDIVNGISCMGCHKHGIIPFKDALRQSFVGRPGEVAAKVLQLFPEQQVLDKVVQQDQQRFLAALDQAIGPFLRSSDADKRDVRDFPEPITAVSKRYGHPVNLERVAAELGLPPTDQEIIETGIRASAAEFKTAIRVSEALRKIELGALASDESLTREQWEKVYQRAARELGIGIPVTIR